MPSEPSNNKRPRRNETMRFAYAGPFVRLLNPIRPVKPVRGPSGVVLRKQPSYAATSPESYTIGSRLSATAHRLEAVFGREYGSVLDALPDEPCTSDCTECMELGQCQLPPTRPKRRRRGSRGGRGRKAVAS